MKKTSNRPQAKQVKLPPRSKNPKDDFPNPGQVNEQKIAEVHENNYFKHHDPDDLRKRYLQFTVFMEQLNNTLGLDRHATVEQFATRVHDLVMAASKV